jgi:hypothetical protein
MAVSDELDSPLFLGPEDWRELAMALDALIVDLDQRYERD